MRHQQASQLYIFTKVLVFTLLVSQANSLSLSWKPKRISATATATTTTRSKLITYNSYTPTRTSINSDATVMTKGSASTTYNGRNYFSSSYHLFRRGTLLSSMNLSATSMKEDEKKTTEKKGNTDTGLKNAIMMGTTLFLKFFVVMIVKFVKDVTIFPTLYMMKFVKKLVSAVKKSPNKSSEEDLDLTRVSFFQLFLQRILMRVHAFILNESFVAKPYPLLIFVISQKVIMGGPGTKF
jgi:hypothetical protein